MRYVWDEGKSRRNLAKHKVSFETATLVFQDPHSISRMDQIVDGEERWQTLGRAGLWCSWLPIQITKRIANL